MVVVHRAIAYSRTGDGRVLSVALWAHLPFITSVIPAVAWSARTEVIELQEILYGPLLSPPCEQERLIARKSAQIVAD
eukprot:2676979-Prymnesium_polylepis.1